MRRNLIILTVLGALMTMAAPASSMAANLGVFPAGHSFEINGGSQLRISGPLSGYCTVSKITGTIPAAPKNETTSATLNIPLAPPSLSCGSMTGTTSGEWTLQAGWGYSANLAIPNEGLTLRYASLPGCKLISSTALLRGIWSNGVSARSAFTPADVQVGSSTTVNPVPMTWNNDGASCAMAGQTEVLHLWVLYTGTAVSSPVTDTTNPAENILLKGGTF